MATLIAIPAIILIFILQTTLARQVTLLNGSVDLILLWLAAWGLHTKSKQSWIWVALAGAGAAYISAVPWYVFPIAYLLVLIIARYLRNHVWQSPLMSMFFVTITGSIVVYSLTLAGLIFTGVNYNLRETLVQVIIPSTFLNLFLALPIFVIVKDMAGWLFPNEATE